MSEAQLCNCLISARPTRSSKILHTKIVSWRCWVTATMTKVRFLYFLLSSSFHFHFWLQSSRTPSTCPVPTPPSWCPSPTTHSISKESLTTFSTPSSPWSLWAFWDRSVTTGWRRGKSSGVPTPTYPRTTSVSWWRWASPWTTQTPSTIWSSSPHPPSSASTGENSRSFSPAGPNRGRPARPRVSTYRLEYYAVMMMVVLDQSQSLTSLDLSQSKLPKLYFM